jgi:hypothetical protein
MAGIPQSPKELQQHLDDHLGFLDRSCDAFDSGHEGEAKRLAVSLRVLFHDTSQSHSLLGQLNRLGGDFVSSAIPHQTGNVATHGGLIMTAMSEGGARYFAPLDDVPSERWLPFASWWNEIVFVDASRAELTRRNLVLAVANQDGGAHVDPHLNEAYARLSRQNSMAWVYEPGGTPIEDAARSAIRQIAHEAMKTLKPGYKRKPDVKADIIFGGGMLSVGGPLQPPTRPAKVGRNQPCPCGSGTKFKKCHGAI